jgi:hypothetical protein
MSEPLEKSLRRHTTLVSTAALIVVALESYGLDWRPIVEEAGFDADKAYLPSERVSSLELIKLWELSVQYSCDPCFGLTYANYIQPSALHELGFSWLTSHTLSLPKITAPWVGLLRCSRHRF